MNQLPLDLARLHLMEDLEGEDSLADNGGRVLRKRAVDSTNPAQTTSKRRCVKLPQKTETMSQIKRIYLNMNFKAPTSKSLETIFEENNAENEEATIGKQKIRRSILFRDGVVNKLKARHRKRMVKRLESYPGHSPRPIKKIRLSLDSVLERLGDPDDVECSAAMCIDSGMQMSMI